MQRYLLTYLHACIHACTYTHIHMHTNKYTYIHTYIHVHIHIHTYAYIHTYTRIQVIELLQHEEMLIESLMTSFGGHADNPAIASFALSFMDSMIDSPAIVEMLHKSEYDAGGFVLRVMEEHNDEVT
jgi:hypothetical protein